jgi:hypothetical protein
MVLAPLATIRLTGYTRLLVLLLFALWLGGAANAGVERAVVSLRGRTRRNPYARAAAAG